MNNNGQQYGQQSGQNYDQAQFGQQQQQQQPGQGQGQGFGQQRPNQNFGGQPAAGGQQSGQQEDYLDKALDSIEKKFGQSTGHQIDPQKYRAQNENITDKARSMFEKFTGKKVPGKFSN